MSDYRHRSHPDDWKEFMAMVHEFHKEYILAVDRKASILLTGLLGFLGLSANALTATSIELKRITLLSFGVCGVLGVVSIVFAAWVVYPRLYDTEYEGYIYWERILKHGTRSQFMDAVMAPPEDNEPKEEITKNVYNLADIASRKYAWLRRSMTVIGLMFYVGSIGALFQLSSHLAFSVIAPTYVSLNLWILLLSEDGRTGMRGQRV